MRSAACTSLGDEIERALREAAPVAPLAPTIAAGAPVERLRAYAAHDPGAARALEDLLLEEDPGSVSSLQRIRKLIRLTQSRMLDARPERFGPLASVLEKLITREQHLLGPPPAPPDAVLAVWAGRDAEAIALIEQHLPDAIGAKEIE